MQKTRDVARYVASAMLRVVLQIQYQASLFYQQRMLQEVSVFGVIFGSNLGIIAVILLKICVATQSNWVAYIQTHKF